MFLMCLALGLGALAEAPKLGVPVVDSYKRTLLEGAQVDLLRPDSTLIKSYITGDRRGVMNRDCNLIIDSIPRTGALLYVTAEGYYPAYCVVPKIGARENMAVVRPIMMNRIPFFKPKELNEVTVTASRVKMVMKGDTIVYNADAFALAQGSMLDGLIDQLPGAELKSDGRILINGKFVKELLVNGDNFFKGDPKIALENLPAYMVKDIQVYHRNESMEQKPKEELPLVMDVRLKKQYQTGWIANAEAGYGTQNRYVGRLFGMLFTRDSRLAIVGNINNTNDDRKPGQTDNWNPNYQTAGRARVLTGGLDYMWNSRLREWKVEANVMAKQKKSIVETHSLSERYLDGGNLMGTGFSSADSRQFRISSDNRIQGNFGRMGLLIFPKFSFERTKTNEIERSTLSNGQTLLNSLDETGLIYNKKWNLGVDFLGSWRLPMRPENISFEGSVKWAKSHNESSRLRELLFPEQPDRSEVSAPEEFMPERRFSANLTLGYGTPTFTPNKYIHPWLKFNYTVDFHRLHSTRDYYLRRLDADALPSVVDATLNAGFVPSNSYDYIETETKHQLKVKINPELPYIDEKWKYAPYFNAIAYLNYLPGHIDYFQNNQTYSARRNPFYVSVDVHFGVSTVGSVSYKFSSQLPSLRSLLDITDAANPLYIYQGNADLKITRVHKVELEIDRSFVFRAAFTKYQNMIAQSADYDMLTGVTTYRPVNINGNWDVTATLDSPWRWSRNKTWQPSFNLRAMYQNSVDLIGREVSTVRNFNLGGKAKLTYKIMEGMELAASGNAEWRKVTSPMAAFSPISAVDFDYGLIFRATKLPWDMSFTTDLMMHSRRGYADSRLNTNDLVWNARLAKSILHGNLTFALDGFDILGQLSNVRLTMNSQGRTETRYNTLPRYAMLHIIYRLNIQPKSTKK